LKFSYDSPVTQAMGGESVSIEGHLDGCLFVCLFVYLFQVFESF